jgi:hypothetical protein
MFLSLVDLGAATKSSRILTGLRPHTLNVGKMPNAAAKSVLWMGMAVC